MARVITSLQHPLVKHLVKLRHNRDYRYEHQAVIVEGIKPINELYGILTPKLIMACDEGLIPPPMRYCEIAIVSEEVMHKVSGMVQPEGLLALMPMPPMSTLAGVTTLLVLDNVSDPGNVGTLVRTALALGWEGVFFVGEGCDPYNDKALRAARGATFKLPFRQGNWQELKQLAQDNKLTPFIADLQGAPLGSIQSEKQLLLVVSNEAHGVSPEALAFCQKVSIPLGGRMESLNVAAAGAILMYSLLEE